MGTTSLRKKTFGLFRTAIFAIGVFFFSPLFFSAEFGVGGSLRLRADTAEDGAGSADGAVRTAVLSDQKAEVVAVLTPEHPRLSDEIILTVTAEHPAVFSLTAPDFGESYGSFRVEKSESLPPTIIDGRETSVFQVTMTPTERGSVTLLPIPLAFHRVGDGNRSEPSHGDGENSDVASFVKKDTELSATPSAEDAFTLLIPAGRITIASDHDPENVSLADMTAPQRPVSERFWRYPLLVAILGGLVALAVYGIICRRKGSQTAEVELSPSERALARLAELMDSAIHKTDVRQFYLTLTEIVRRFIEETTGIRAPEQTTEEFLRAVEIDSQSNFGEPLQRDLADFLEFADLVKFAKFRPTDEEIASGYRSARSLILHDFQTTASEESSGGQTWRDPETSQGERGKMIK